MNIRSFAHLALLAVIAGGSAGSYANSYTLVDLGQYIYPTGIDSKGQISAILDTRKRHHRREIALVYSGGKWHQLAPRHETVTAVGVNKSGVAGNTKNGATIWLHHGQPMTLPLPPQGTQGIATGINSKGDVAGYFYGLTRQHCFVWSSSTGLSQDLDPKMDSCETAGIDDRGRIYGSANINPRKSVNAFAFSWHDGHTHKLPPLAVGYGAMALAGNPSGDAVGWAVSDYEGLGYPHAVLWHAGIVNDLLPYDWESVANGISNDGTIVGQGIEPSNDDPEWQAMRFIAGKKFVFLYTEVTNGPSNFNLIDATAISPNGMIVGTGYFLDSSGREHGFLLIPQ